MTAPIDLREKTGKGKSPGGTWCPTKPEEWEGEQERTRKGGPSPKACYKRTGEGKQKARP